MPISKIPVGAIQSGTIGTSQIADNAVTTAKILNDNVTSAKIPNDAIGSTEIAASAVTRDELQSAAVNNISSDSIILNSTNGTADAGDFLVLDGTDGSSSNANHRILYDETFVDKIGLFNINTLGSAGTALKVDSAGTGFEFGSAGGLVKLSHSDFSGSSSVEFGDTLITDTYLTYLVETKLIFSANAGLQFQISPDNGVTNSYTTTFAYQHSRNDTSSSGGSKVTSSNYMSTGWSPGNQTGDVLVMSIRLQNFRETTGYKWIKVNANINAQGSDYTWEGGGELKLETKQNYFKIYPASGTMTGYATIYGLSK